MKKIIEHGFMNHMETQCPYCGCRFSFDWEDVIFESNSFTVSHSIFCPECAKSFPILNLNITMSKKDCGTRITYTTTSTDTCTTGCSCDKCSHKNH